MSLSAFLAENAVAVENVKFVASKRFLSDEQDYKGNRKPMEWEIKTITGTEDEALRKSCAKRVPIPGKKSQYQKETDYDMYLGKLAVACTVFPDLNNKELQDSYKVMGAESLHELHLIPSAFFALNRRERAFIIAAIEIRVEKEKEKQKELERKQHRGKRRH